MSARAAILFVDDDAAVLAGLRRQLYDRRGDWELCFAEDGFKALQAMRERSFDVIVSDMRMPGMSGAELLEAARELRPETLRVLLSGFSNEEHSLRTIQAAHRHLSKPCDPAQLRATLDGILQLGSLIGEAGVRRRLAQMVSLPVSSGLLRDISEELDRPQASLARLGQLVEFDPGLSAKVLQLVHCAYVGLGHRVERPSQAVLMLGTEHLRGLLQGLFALRRIQESGLGAGPEAEREAWEHGLAVAGVARQLAQGHGEGLAGLAFTAGVVHDLGGLVLSALDPAASSAVRGRADEEAETAACGASHARAGAYLLGLWGLPDAIVQAVAGHHRADPGPDPLARALAEAEATVDRPHSVAAAASAA